MNKRERMAEQIRNHGETLVRLYGSKGQDPVALCKALHRIEHKVRQTAVDWCNGEKSESDWANVCEWAKPRIADLLPRLQPAHLHLNGDPRGYALKVEDAHTPAGLHRDMGGYGILCPEFDGSR